MQLTKNVTKVVLDNGLTVLVKENHNAPVVAILSYVKAGYFNEPDHLVGISHLIEHMFFKGTRKRGVAQIARETKALGGYLNASTIYDHTLYYTVLPSESFSQGLDIQSDALMNLVFDSGELKKETEVVIQEAKRKLDTPSAFATEKMFELAFENHRMRRWRIGTEDGLRALTRDDFLTFYKNLYRPENIILVVVGDVETNQVVREINLKYAHFEKGGLIKEESPPEPPQRQFRYRFLEGDIQQSYLRIGFHTPEILHPDTYALEILSILLGHGHSSRLFQMVKEEKRLVHSIFAYNYTLSDLGVFVIDAVTKAQNLRAAMSAAIEELARFQHTLVSKDELSKARNLLESLYVFSLTSISGQANILANYEALEDYHLAEIYLQRLYEVSEEDVIRVAKKYLTPTNCSLLEYVPEDANLMPATTVKIEKEVEAYLLSGLAEEANQPGKTAFEPLILEQISSYRKEKDVTRSVLSNGLTLLVKESHQIPVVSIGVFAKGGRARENASIAGITGLNARTLLKGTRNRTASQIALEIENLGTGILLSSNPDYISCTMNILSKNFNAGWDIFTDVITEPVFPEEELNKEKENAVAQILRSKDDMFRYPLQLFYSVLFKGHAYGLPANGEIDIVKSISRESLFDWYSGHFAAANLVVSVVGDVDSNKIQELVEERLCSLKSNTVTRESSILDKPDEIKYRIESREKNQTALTIGFYGPAYTNEDYYPLTVLQNILSGLGGRFFEELRSRQSLAYTVSAYLISRLYGGAFLAYIATSPENEKRAKDGLLREFEKLTTRPVSNKELKQSIQYTIGTHKIGLETYGAQMMEFAHNELLGKSAEEVEAFGEKIKKVTAEDILQAAQKYFDLNRYCIGMVRGKMKSDVLSN